MGSLTSGGADLALQVAAGTLTGLDDAGESILLRGNFNLSVWGTFSATVALERSFDGGSRWIRVTFSDGNAITYTAAASAVWSEPEFGVSFRFRCIAYTSGSINWRLSLGSDAPTSTPINISDGAPNILPNAPINILSSTYNAITNTPSIASSGAGVGSGANNGYIVATAGTVAADSIGTVSIGDIIFNSGGTKWLRAPYSAVYKTMSLQDANAVAINGGSIVGQTMLGLSNGDSISPGTSLIPDLVEWVEDSAGNIIETLDYTGTRRHARLQADTLTVPGTATITNIQSSGTAVTNVLTIAAGAQSFQVAPDAVPDLVEWVEDSAGNIIEGTDYTGRKIVNNLLVIGTLSNPSAPSGSGGGTGTTCPGDALDVTAAKYGAIGDGVDDVFWGTWTSGASTLTLGKYSGAATWSTGQPLVLGAITSGQGRGFEPFDVGNYVYVAATDGSGVVATVQITGWNSSTSVTVSANPSASVTAADIVWPAFVAAHVGKAIRIEGAAMSLGRQAYNNGLVPWIGTIATVAAGNQVTVTGITPTFSTSNTGKPARVSWGTDNSRAYTKVSADLMQTGKQVVWHPATAGQAKTVYCAFGLAAPGPGENSYSTYAPDTTMLFNFATMLGDVSVVSVHTDTTGRELYRRVIPIRSAPALAPKRDLIGRIHLPRMGATATPAWMEIGDSLSKYDPTGQSLAWSQISLIEGNVMLENPSKTFTFLNYGTTGLGYWETVDPAAGLPWLQNGYDTFYVGSHGRNDGWRIHPLPIQSTINLIRGRTPDGGGRPPDIMLTTADSEPQSPGAYAGMTHDAAMFSQMLIRTMARVNGVGLLDFSWPSDQAANGTDEMHREYMLVPRVGTAHTLAKATPLQIMVETHWYSMSFVLTGSTGAALWAAIGQLSISLSPMAGNVVVLDADPVSNWLRVEPRAWGNSCSTTVSTSGATLTTTAGTATSGTLTWLSSANQLTHSGSPFTGTAGLCILMPGVGTSGAPQRSFIRQVVNGTTAVVDDFWWGNAGGISVSTLSDTVAVSIGGMQFIPSDATAQVDVVMTWGTNSSYRGKITGYTDANTVTLSPAPPSLSGQAVTFWLGMSLGQRTLTGIAASTGSGTQTFAISLQGDVLSIGQNNLVPNIYRGHVVRFGNKFCPQISVSGAGSATITATWIYVDRPVYYHPTGTPWGMWGNTHAASIGGGGGPHPGSLQAVRTTQRTVDAADWCAT